MERAATSGEYMAVPAVMAYYSLEAYDAGGEPDIEQTAELHECAGGDDHDCPDSQSALNADADDVVMIDAHPPFFPDYHSDVSVCPNLRSLLSMSLFRYPGGKDRYKKFILPTLFRCSGFSIYIDPFVGGGSVALAMAARYPDIKLILNDLDVGVSAFWDLVANAPDSEFKELEDQILKTCPTVALFNEIKESQPTDRFGRAFRALYLNRTSYGGMGLRPLGGKNQTSVGKIDSRWNAKIKVEELHDARRLLAGRTKVLNADFASVIPLAAGANTLMFLDPQYYQAGNQLYNFKWSDADHVRLRDALTGKSNWVMSYDDHPFIRDLYKVLAYVMSVQYSMGKKRKKMSEVLLSTRLEFPTDFNPDVGVGGIGATLRIWVKGYGPND